VERRNVALICLICDVDVIGVSINRKNGVCVAAVATSGEVTGTVLKMINRPISCSKQAQLLQKVF